MDFFVEFVQVLVKDYVANQSLVIIELLHDNMQLDLSAHYQAVVEGPKS